MRRPDLSGSRAGRVVLAAAFLLATALPLAGAATPRAAAADEPAGQGQVLLVLDASGSMREPAGDGRTRFQAATAAVREVLGTVPDDLAVGLRVYGARVEDGPGSCQDSRLVVPVDRGNRSALRAALSRAEPLGNTPIAHSLRQAAQDLPEDGQRTVVLVSDGEESCGGDPCQVARDLSAQGFDLRVDVVGFQVDGAARDQLTCIAQAGRGTFYDAPDAAALTAQLERLSARAARAYVPAGVPVEGARDAASAPTLEPGQYLDTIGDGGEHETYRIAPDRGSAVHLSATIRPTIVRLADVEAVEMTVTAAGEEQCAAWRESGMGAFDKLTPVTVGGSLAAEELRECGPGPYAVRAERVDDDAEPGGDGVKPLEVTYIQEPGVAGVAGLPAAAEEDTYAVRPRVRGTAVPAVGAPSFTGAPVLAEGRYRDSILVGETLLYGVELDWGQQLACRVEYGRSPALDRALGSSHTPTAMVRVYGPTRMHLLGSGFADTDSALYYGERASVIHTATPPVRYRNRETGYDVTYASVPGTYYCAAFLNGDSDYASGGEVPTTVTLDVVGTAGEGAPTYVDGAAGPVDDPTGGPADSTAEASPDGSEENTDDVVPAAGEGSGTSMLLAGLVLLVLVPAGWLAARTLTRSRP